MQFLYSVIFSSDSLENLGRYTMKLHLANNFHIYIVFLFSLKHSFSMELNSSSQILHK